MRTRVACLVASAFMAALSGVFVSALTSQGVSAADTTYQGPSWIISAGAVQSLEAAGLSTSEANYFFNNPRTYIIGSKSSVGFTQAIGTTYFSSYAAMQTAFASGGLSSGVGAVLYDPEPWSLTPLAEQIAPKAAAAAAEALVHAHNLQFVYTPAESLTIANGGLGGSAFTNYLSGGYASWGAGASDAFEVQSEHLQTPTS